VKKTLLICIAWLALTASIASAGGISLAWNDCLGAGGASNRTFACDTNVGNNDLYVSFDPSVDLPDVNGAGFTIDLSTYPYSPYPYPPLPAWWQFKNVGTCRLTALSAQTIPGGCADPWNRQAIPSIAAYYVAANTPSLPLDRARILATVSVPAFAAVAVYPGTEYTVMVIRITNARTTGLGACDGCALPICLVLSEVLLTTNNSGDLRMRNSIQYDCPGDPGTTVSWQGTSTPTLNRTWGQVKTLYR
jgi:hypothetical protein